MHRATRASELKMRRATRRLNLKCVVKQVFEFKTSTTRPKKNLAYNG